MPDENPLILPILNIIKKQKTASGIYQLITTLENNNYVLVKNISNQSHDLILFQKNFVVMNALYQLKKDLIETGYGLSISSLKIELIPEVESGQSLLSKIEQDCDKTSDALSLYYLNWGNFNQVDEGQVKGLLNDFWLRFEKNSKKQTKIDKRLDSLHVLGLESNASWKNIQQTYRQLVIMCHPDKGGNSLQFIKIREAYIFLKLTQDI